MSEEQSDYDSDEYVKVAIIGASNAGKSSIVGSFTKGFCPIPDVTLYSQLSVKDVDLSTRIEHFSLQMKARLSTVSPITKLVIHDFAGFPRFRELNKTTFNGVFALIVVFDLTSLSSLSDAVDCLQHFDVCRQLNELRDPVLRILVANKSDKLEHCLSYEDLLEFSEKSSFQKVFQTSAVSGKNIEELFVFVSLEYLKYKVGAK